MARGAKDYKKKGNKSKSVTNTKANPAKNATATATATANSKTTLSGLNPDGSTILVLTGILGMLIFVLGPYVANQSQRPTTAALLNVVPNGMFMAYFIEESEFSAYINGLIFAPVLNVVLNMVTLVLYRYKIVSPIWCISVNILAWLFIVLASYFLF